MKTTIPLSLVLFAYLLYPPPIYSFETIASCRIDILNYEVDHHLSEEYPGRWRNLNLSLYCEIEARDPVWLHGWAPQPLEWTHPHFYYRVEFLDDTTRKSWIIPWGGGWRSRQRFDLGRRISLLCLPAGASAVIDRI